MKGFLVNETSPKVVSLVIPEGRTVTLFAGDYCWDSTNGLATFDGPITIDLTDNEVHAAYIN